MTPDSVSENQQNKDDDPEKSNKKSDKRKNTQPKPKKPKKDNEKLNVVTWDCALCPGAKFSDNNKFMRHLYKDHQIRPQGNSAKK